MCKKMISAVLAAATAISLSATAFAAETADPSHKAMEVGTLVSTPEIKMTYPTVAAVVLNPYKMKVALTATAGKDPTVKADASKGDDSTVLSADMTFTNGGDSAVQITVTGSVTAVTTVDSKGNALLNADGEATDSIGSNGQAVDENGKNVSATSKITFATAAIKQPTWDTKGEKIVAGETKNSVLLYVEVGESAVSGSTVTYTYSGAYDSKSDKQMLLSNKETKKALCTLGVSDTKDKTANVAQMKVCGDVATAPTLGWDQVAKTDSIKVALVFDVSPVAPLPEKPVTTTAP